MVFVPGGRYRPGVAEAVTLPDYWIDQYEVTNARFKAFVDAGGYRDARWWRAEDWEWVVSEHLTHPPFWERDDSGWRWRGMFESVSLPLDWPVYVTWAEANAYAAWRGLRLPTESQYIRAASGTGLGNCDFVRWDPEPVGQRRTSVSEFGVRDLAGNGWEWTADVFAPFSGFTPLPSYPEYSADFFDASHFVMKGASPVTAEALVRPGFRNWFRPRYPYVYATFRCVDER
jgi:formylglycine-generating enzyme required for sulfatase activity